MSTGDKFKLVWAILDQYKEEGQFKGLKWPAIAEKLGIDRPGTAQVRWHRLQKEFESGKLWDESAAEATPKKGKKATDASNTTTPKKAAKTKSEAKSEDEEAEMSGPVEIPTKKGAEGKKAGTNSVKTTPKKTPKAKAGTKRKHDEVEEDEAKVEEEEEEEEHDSKLLVLALVAASPIDLVPRSCHTLTTSVIQILSSAYPQDTRNNTAPLAASGSEGAITVNNFSPENRNLAFFRFEVPTGSTGCELDFWDPLESITYDATTTNPIPNIIALKPNSLRDPSRPDYPITYNNILSRTPSIIGAAFFGQIKLDATVGTDKTGFGVRACPESYANAQVFAENVTSPESFSVTDRRTGVKTPGGEKRQEISQFAEANGFFVTHF
ncbi:hypothetical protein B0J14DRAFT_638321 [Halenospora varia]|nr:hypothetical protein B0J14DRAFT_638321 [Halenospora varia]